MDTEEAPDCVVPTYGLLTFQLSLNVGLKVGRIEASVRVQLSVWVLALLLNTVVDSSAGRVILLLQITAQLVERGELMSALFRTKEHVVHGLGSVLTCHTEKKSGFR